MQATLTRSRLSVATPATIQAPRAVAQACKVNVMAVGISSRRRRLPGTLALLSTGTLLACSFGGSTGFVAPPGGASRRNAMGARHSDVGMAALTSTASVEAYELPPLRYPYDALEPTIDKETMHFHHDKHHNTYVVNLNKALEGQTRPPLTELQKSAIQAGPAIRNNGGGVYNHDFFWLVMAPKGQGGSPSSKLAAAITATFGSLDEFKAKFEAAGAPGARFGSGWVWLVVTTDGKLAITSTPNQDNPLMLGAEGTPGIPILTCDVWEHAYYLQYQFRRPDYLKAWWDVVNWNQVNVWYEDALAGKAPIVDGP